MVFYKQLVSEPLSSQVQKQRNAVFFNLRPTMLLEAYRIEITEQEILRLIRGGDL
ncbi:hypothetical protein JCM19046_2674 [Bacillus sp. JCM 19046]|nr:hypothetical protein JCM19045_4840 [Bacillus sp. JCM 19045]GAF18120.1 hypothetical protein JCM19046_2674 [Bacillus sp. JCM 19046]